MYTCTMRIYFWNTSLGLLFVPDILLKIIAVHPVGIGETTDFSPKHHHRTAINHSSMGIPLSRIAHPILLLAESLPLGGGLLQVNTVEIRHDPAVDVVASVDVVPELTWQFYLVP